MNKIRKKIIKKILIISAIRTTNPRPLQFVKDKTTPRNRDEEEIMGYRDVLNTITKAEKAT